MKTKVDVIRSLPHSHSFLYVILGDVDCFRRSGLSAGRDGRPAAVGGGESVYFVQ